MSQLHDDIFKEHGSRVLKNMFEEDSKRDGKNPGSVQDAHYTLALIVLVIFFGYDIIRAFFRKNYIVNKWSLLRHVIAFCILGLLSIYFFTQLHVVNKTMPAEPIARMVVGIIFVFTAFFILFKGITQFNKTQKNNPSLTEEGTTLYFKWLKKMGLTEKQVQHIVEPSIALVAGIGLFFFDLMLSIVAGVSGISVWLYMLAAIILGDMSLSHTIVRMDKKYNPDKDFYNDVRTKF